MYIELDNFGPLKKAKFDIADLTIICGENNTGKTYATHATYALLDFIRSSPAIDIDNSDINQLIEEGSVIIELKSHIENIQQYLQQSSRVFTNELSTVFASSESLFEGSTISLNIENLQQRSFTDIDVKIGSSKTPLMRIISNSEAQNITVSLLKTFNESEFPPRRLLKDIIKDGIGQLLFEDLIPRPFIASAERTGAAIFQKELDFTRNRILEMLSEKEAKFSPIKFLKRFGGEYPIAISRNVDFIRELSTITNKESYVLKEHASILLEFRDLIGGEYKVIRDEIKFIPNKSKGTKLSLMESSSAVRSLLDIGFYLRHIANKGDILMIDEPELNLHPNNQRKIARLFAKLVNIGIKIFITTHSDYIIREFSTLLMLNQKGERFNAIRKQEKYSENELLRKEQVKLYIAQEELVLLKGNQKRTKCKTLVPIITSQHEGIEAKSFNATISEMNRIQDELLWG